MTTLINILNKRKITYVCSFVIPLLILIAVFAALQIVPFGDNTLLYSDADGQYIAYYSFFHRFLHGNGSMFYSFSKGIGGNMLNQSFGYLFNPFYYLFYFGEYETFPTIYSIICILNTAISGTTMFVFLNNVFKKRNSYLLFSTVYALCGFAAVNNWQLHWLMSVSLLPLIALGIHKIVKGQSPVLYFIVLAYTIMQGYHLGYMLCLFSVIYFLMLLIVTKNESDFNIHIISKKRITVRYILSTLLAGFTASFVWIPSLLSLMEGRATQIGLDDFEFVENMPFAQIGSKLFSGANSTDELVNGLPNIYCTLFVVALAVFFFFDKANSKRKKTGYFVVLMIYLLSFYIRTFSSVFNMFSKANWFNYRSSFVFPFLLIIIAVDEYNRIHGFSVKDIKKCLLIMLAATIIVFIQKYEYISGGMVVIDWLLLLLMLWLTIKTRKELAKGGSKILAIILMICIGINLYINYYYTVKSIDDWKKTSQVFNDEIFNTAILAESLQATDSNFYRMETDNPRKGSCGTDGMLYGYYGAGNFSSTERAFVTKGLSRFGIDWFDMRNSYNAGVPAAMDSFLGLKYIMSNNDLSEEEQYKFMINVRETRAYENPFVLPISILSDKELSDIDPNSVNIFELQNLIWKRLTSSDKDIFTPVTDIAYTLHNIAEVKEYTTSGDKLDIGDDDIDSSDDSDNAINQNQSDSLDYYMECNFTAEQSQPIYLYIGGLIDNNGSTSDPLRYIGTYNVGEHVTGKIEMNDFASEDAFEYLCDHNCIYYENLDVLKEYSSIIQNKNAIIQKDAEDKLSGSFTIDKDQTLLFTIPYDVGWTLYIDDTPVEYEKTLGIFMSTPVSAGAHTWRMVYVPEGFKMATMISIGSLLLFVIFMIIDSRSRKKQMAAIVTSVNASIIEDNTDAPELQSIDEESKADTIVDTEEQRTDGCVELAESSSEETNCLKGISGVINNTKNKGED